MSIQDVTETRRVRPVGNARVLTFLLPGVVGLYGVYQGIQQALLPTQAEHIDATNKIAVLALASLVSSIVGTIALPLGAALSDRTRGRFGRRAPWLLASSVLAAVGCVLMARATSVPTLIVGIGFLWFFANIYQGVIYAIVPDRVPEKLRGTASSVVGLGLPIGILVFVNIVTRTSQFWGYAIVGLFLVVATVAFIVFVPEGPVSAPQVQQRTERAPLLKSVGGFFSGFTSKDFTLVFISRFFFFTGLFAILGFVLYFISDFIGVRNTPFKEAGTALATVSTVQTIAQITAVVIFGYVADRFNSRKLVVGVSAVAFAIALFAPLVLQNWTGLVIYAVLGGAAQGVYFAVDLAVMSLILPNRGHEGRDLALLALATSVPAALAPLAAAGVYAVTGGYAAIFIFAAVASVLSAVFIFLVRSVR